MEESMTEENKTEDECKFLEIIQKYSGLTVSASHRDFMLNYVDERKKELGLSDEEYCRKLEEDILERTRVIDEAAINETYFFREVIQFDFLRDTYFPKHKNVVIWSAACSTGEEPISLYALAKSCRVNASVYASDIDEKALSQIKNRIYTPHSFRSEGSNYIGLLEQLGTYYPKTFTMSKETLESLFISKFNLATDHKFPMPNETVDLLFLRNVFIYFTKETRKEVLIKLAGAMKENALLFLSINEIASVECDMDMPFVKENCGPVYYLRKVGLEEKKRLYEAKIHHGHTEPQLTRTIPHKAKKTDSFCHEHKNANPVNAMQKQCTMTELYKDLKAAISLKDFDHARELISRHKFKTTEMEHELFMKGMIFEAQGNNDEALDCYQRASIANPKFWPASYNLGTLSKKLGNSKNMKKAFLSCSKALKCYIQNQEICYNDILDSFNPDYFLELCDSQIEGGR